MGVREETMSYGGNGPKVPNMQNYPLEQMSGVADGINLVFGKIGYIALISDLDGTLIEKHPGFIKEYTKRFLEEFGIHLTDAELDDYLKIEPESKRAQRLETLGVNPREFSAKWRDSAIIQARRKYAQVFPDVRALVRLKEKKVKLGIVTRANPDLSKMEISVLEEVLGVSNLFDSVVNVDRYSNVPKHVGLLMCMEELGVGKKDVLTLGNEAIDAEEAQKAELDVVLIERPGYSLPPLVRKIGSLDELCKYF